MTRDLTVALKSTEQSWNFRNIQTSEGKVDCKCVLGKVKIRQKFCQGVAEGRRRGSGKIVTGFYGELVEISGGCGCTNPLEFDQRSSYIVVIMLNGMGFIKTTDRRTTDPPTHRPLTTYPSIH